MNGDRHVLLVEGLSGLFGSNTVIDGISLQADPQNGSHSPAYGRIATVPP